MKKFLRKSMVAGLAIVFSVSMLACGSKENTENQQGGTGENAGAGNGTNAEYVYVPEYYSMSLEENAWINNPVMTSDRLYYSVQSFDEATGESKNYYASRAYDAFETEEKVDLSFSLEGYEVMLNQAVVDNQKNVYAHWYGHHPYVEGEEYNDEGVEYLVKYDSTGAQVYAQEITDIYVDEENTYLQNLVATNEGKLVASSGTVFYMFGADGSFEKTIPSDTDWINGMCISSDGMILYSAYGMNGPEMIELDPTTGARGKTYKNLPNDGGTLKAGSEGKLLVSGSTKLYEYDCATQEISEILTWVDSDVDGNYIQDFVVLEDGRIIVYYDNYEADAELIVLTKKPASEAVQKEIITIATLYDEMNLQQAAVAFNKTNDKYRVEIKCYIDNNAEWTETTYEDAVALLNADIISNNAPDMVALESSINVNSLVSKGAFLDLTPYLEKSTIANKGDFLESVLKAYNYDGVQIAVPSTFSISTLMAKSSYVGEKQGWTLEDVIALAKKYPDAEVMNYMNNYMALQLCLMNNDDVFIDYENGTCNFNSPEFIKVLEFANSFGEDINYDDDMSFPAKLQSGKLLLADAYFSDIQEYQMYRLMLDGEATCIGYPTVDGSVGTFIQGNDLYCIVATTDCADGAWAFLENTLAKNDSEYGRWGLSSRKDEIEENLEEAMTPQYQYDENGEIMYDEAGNPIQVPKTTWGYDDWEAEIYAATQEEVDDFMELISVAKPISNGDHAIFSIINEEAASYFEGQKSAEDVAKIIQSRLEIYVSENS